MLPTVWAGDFWCEEKFSDISLGDATTISSYTRCEISFSKKDDSDELVRVKLGLKFGIFPLFGVEIFGFGEFPLVKLKFFRGVICCVL